MILDKMLSFRFFPGATVVISGCSFFFSRVPFL